MEQVNIYDGYGSNTYSRMSYVFAFLIIFAGFIECIWGVLQIFGFIPSGHRRFLVTGSFYNPGPFGCFLACVLPIVTSSYLSRKHKRFTPVFILFFVMCIFLLPGGLSRSGWIAAVIGCAFTVYSMNKYKLDILRKSPLLIFLSIVICLIFLTAIYLYKQDSADGRLFIWKVAVGYLCEIPLLGVGWQNVAGVYGLAQESYFNMCHGTQREILLADAPSYLYNEYLQIAFAYGIPCALLFVALLITSFILFYRSRRFGFAGSILSFAICCLTSYPLQFWEFKLLVCLLVIFSGLFITDKIRRLFTISLYTILCGLFLATSINFDVDEPYDQAHQLASIGQFDKANKIAKSLLYKNSSNELLMFIGDNYQRMGLRDSAEYYFLRGATRIPNRLYPHYRLMKLHLEEPADSIKAKIEATTIIGMTPKVPSIAAMQIRQEAVKFLNIPISSQQIVIPDL